MALELGYGKDEAEKWLKKSEQFDDEYFSKKWEATTEKLFGNIDKNGLTWSRFAYLGMSSFPDDYA